LLGDRRARYRCVGPFVPNDRQSIEGRLGPPPGIGNDGDGGVLHLDDLAHAGAARDLGCVVACDLTAEHRAVLDRGAQHVRQLDIDCVDLAAVELVGGIDPFHRLAGDFPVFRILELDGFEIRRFELGRGCGELAIAQRAAGRGVGDHAVGNRQLGNGDLPFVRRRLQQHHARGGAAAADIILRAADAAAATGRHVAPDSLAGKVLPGRDLFRPHLIPIALELLGDELDEARDRPLSHLRARDADHARIVGLDEDPGIDLGAFALRHGGTEAGGQIESERESTAGSGGADNERAARKLRGFAADRLFHGTPP
jgi:hypothetical protein